MSYQLVKAGEDINQQGRNYREYLIDSSADLSSLPTAKMSEGSRAYTKEYKSVYKLKEDGSWQTVKEGNESGSGSGSGPSGSSTEAFMITVTATPDSEENPVYSADITYTEIVDAWNKGQRVMYILPDGMEGVQQGSLVVSYSHTAIGDDPRVDLVTVHPEGVLVYKFYASGELERATYPFGGGLSGGGPSSGIGELVPADPPASEAQA